jgi:hypothetical protein
LTEHLVLGVKRSQSTVLRREDDENVEREAAWKSRDRRQVDGSGLVPGDDALDRYGRRQDGLGRSFPLVGGLGLLFEARRRIKEPVYDDVS